MKYFAVWLAGLLLPALASASELTSDRYAVCMDEAGGVTMAMIDCIGEEFASQDARLNEVYQRLREGLPGERRQALREAQRAWIAYRDANCRFYATSGGTLARVAANQCMLRETAERAGELDRLRSP